MRRRVSLVAVLLITVGLLGCSSGSEVAEDSAPTTMAPATTIVPAEDEPDDDVCVVDDNSNNVDCPQEEIVLEDSLEGAVERVRRNATWDSDLRHLMLTETGYREVIEPNLGPAELVPGAVMPIYGFYEPALSGFGEPVRWQQEWTLENSATIVEQIVLLDSADDAAVAFDGWRASASASGLTALKFATSAPGAFDTAYSDPTSVFSGRTCAAQSIVAVSRFLVSVTYLTGGDCRVAPAPVAAAVLAGVAARIAAVFPG